MTEGLNNIDFDFKTAAAYRIVVQGKIDAERAESLLGLQATIKKINNQKFISMLVGQINDQAALSGILNMLYEMHMTVISVNMLSEIEKPNQAS